MSNEYSDLSSVGNHGQPAPVISDFWERHPLARRIVSIAVIAGPVAFAAACGESQGEQPLKSTAVVTTETGSSQAGGRPVKEVVESVLSSSESVSTTPTQTNIPTQPVEVSVSPSAIPEKTRQPLDLSFTKDMVDQAKAPGSEGGGGMDESGVQTLLNSLKKLSEYPEVWSKVTSNDPRENAQGLCAANEAAFKNDDIGIAEAIFGGQDAHGFAAKNIEQMQELIEAKQKNETNPNPVVDYSCTLLPPLTSQKDELGKVIGSDLGAKLQRSSNGVVSDSINEWNNKFFGTNYDVAGLMTESIKFADGSEKTLRNETVLSFVWQQFYSSNGEDHRARFSGKLTNEAYYQHQ